MELKWKQNCDSDHLMWNIRTQQRGYQRHLDVRTCSTDAVMRELRLTNGQQSLKATVHLKAFKLVLDLLRKVSSAVKTCRWAPSWLLSIILEAHSHTMQLKGCTNGSTGKSYRSSELLLRIFSAFNPVGTNASYWRGHFLKWGHVSRHSDKATQENRDMWTNLFKMMPNFTGCLIIQVRDIHQL